jgi:hypothetical protein
MKARETFLLGPQTELREQGAIFERGGDNAFAKGGDCLSDNTNALLVFRRKKKGPEERAMDAIAEGKFGRAQPLEKLLRKTPRIA